MQGHISRRRFLKGAASLGIGVVTFPHLIPSSALGLAGSTTPSNRIAMGFIGVGDMGTAVMQTFIACKDAQAVAVCDVNSKMRERAISITGLKPEAAYNDFRELLARNDIDAVVIATPDHWHVLQAIATAKAGKDIYCQKPLGNTVAEGRQLVNTVQRYGAVFQHGTQLRSVKNVRFACELVRNGRIGKLHTITVGSPQGRTIGPQVVEAVPEGFDYDLWLGPAPSAPYTPLRVAKYGWYFISDYSKAGFVAGHGVHDIDIAQWGMGTELTGPVEVEGEGVFPTDGLYDTVVTYRLEFKYANGVKLVMTSTDQNPNGVRFEGTDGWVFTRFGIDAHPKSLLNEVISPNEIRLYVSKLHEQNFLDCVKTRARTIAPVEVAHRSTTTCLIGGIALKLRRKLRWDPDNERFIDDPEANRLLGYTMRAPWHL